MALVSNLYRITWFWEALGQGGSETLMLRRADSNTGTVADGIIAVCEKRAKLLGNLGALRGLRVARYTDAAANRVLNVSELRRFTFPGTQTSTPAGGVNGPNPGENFVQSLQLVCYEPISGKRKLIYLGYPWENCFPGNQVYQPAPAFTTALNSFTNDLVVGGWGWISKERGLPISIINYVEDPNTGKVTLTLTSPVAGWPTPKPVEVNIAFVGKNPLDGRRTVQPLTATTCVTTDSIGVREFALAGAGLLYPLEESFLSMNPGWPATTNLGRMAPVQPVKRARGKSSLSTRGRSPTEIRW